MFRVVENLDRSFVEVRQEKWEIASRDSHLDDVTSRECMVDGEQGKADRMSFSEPGRFILDRAAAHQMERAVRKFLE